MQRRWFSLVLVTALGCSKSVRGGVEGYAGARSIGMEVTGAEGPWAPAADPVLLATGTWIQVGDEVAYVYVDAEQGLSARVQPDTDRIRIRRLSWAPAGAQTLNPAEAGLPAVAPFVEGYQGQPPPGTLYGHWRTDERLVGRLHPDYPDDLRVVVGRRKDDGSIMTELPWLGLRTCDEEGCVGALLNEPYDDLGMHQGASLAFRWSDLDANVPVPVVPVGELVPDWLRSAAQAYQGALQDDPATLPDWGLPPEERLPPTGRWVDFVGVLAWSVMRKDGPWLVLFHPDGTTNLRRMDWRPRGLVDLPEEEIARMGLKPLKVPDAVEAVPGPCCAWRLDERLADRLGLGSPDQLLVALSESPVGQIPSLDTEIGSMSIYTCDDAGCMGVVQGGPHDGRDAWLPWLALDASRILSGEGRLRLEDQPALPDTPMVPVAELR